MLVNVFLDYRMTDYSDAHSRLGLGGEYYGRILNLEITGTWQ